MVFILHRHGFLTGDSAGPEVEAAYGELINKQVDELTNVVDETLEALEKIKRDRGLNIRGQGEQIRKVAGKGRTEIRRLGELRRRKLDQDLSQVEQSIPEALPEPKMDPILAVSRQEEIRRFMIEMTAADRESEVMTAAEQNDLTLLLAVQNAPRVLRLVRPDTFKKAKERWLELNKPDEFTRRSTVKSAMVVFDHNVQRSIRLVVGYNAGESIADDLVKAQAG